MKKLATSQALYALSRTAKWSMDDAYIAHGKAIGAREQSQQALTVAQQQLEQSHDHLRQMLVGPLDANTLQYRHLQNVHYQQLVLECDKQLLEKEKQTEQTQQQLLDAKVRTETYLRLTQRREKLVAHEFMRQQLRLADEFGVVRAATPRTTFYSINGEDSHGN